MQALKLTKPQDDPVYLFLLKKMCIRDRFITVGIFLIRALSRYVKSGNVRNEKSSIKKSLGEVLKQHREEC